ncbi:MAG TPA: SUMF1/EgtB/PvdO family nonheme iron enzyme [Polyangiaceae bacterium]
MRHRVVIAVILCAPLAPGIGSAQTPGHDDGTEEGEPVPSASASASAPPLHPVALPHAVVQKDGMVQVAGGKFTMGTNDAKAAPNEKPAHESHAATFWIDRTEVTVAAYRACVESRKCELPQKTAATCTYDLGDDLLPVSCVRWQDADAFCRAENKRLPSEQEWELAARGGGAFKYPWGNSPSSCFQAATLLRNETGRSCTGLRPARVGSYVVNTSPFGAVDMAGNLEEWTASWYVEHLASGARPTSGASHVLRGGGWLSRPIDSRTTSRSWGSSVEAGPNAGFRCVKDN